MPSPPILDLEALAAPIPGENPAGGSVPFAVREKLEEDRKEIDPEGWAANDPTRPETPKKADWPSIIGLAQQTLKETSKDLLVSARLTEALTKQHGFAGLRDGLSLMQVLAHEAWERLNPLIESEDDLEIRAAPFFWLDDTDRGARFPTTIRAVPIIEGDKSGYGWQVWKDATGGKGKTSIADIEKAISVAPRDRCQLMVDDLNLAWEALEALTQTLNGKMGRYAPGFSGLRGAIGDCRSLAQQILQKKGPAPAESAPAGDAAGAAGGGTVVVVEAKRMATRADVYEKLAEAADLLKQIEPHSPIPYLINRAIELGALPFPDLMKALILNADVLKMMNREMGIKEGPEKK